MTDTTASPPVDPGPPPPAPPGLPTGSDRFFSWVRGLGVVRGDAWLGGVCGGLAARLRIDPIIVRGIFAVVAVLGFPALLIYAIAWALLPDAVGRIHLRELFHGRFDPAMIGILILTVLSFVPVVPWLWNAALWPVWATFGGGYGLPIWDLGTPFGGIGVILTLALIGGAVFLIVRSARSDRHARAPRQASAESDPAQAASHSGDDAAVAFAATAGGDADSAGRAPAGSANSAAATDDLSTSPSSAPDPDAATAATTAPTVALQPPAAGLEPPEPAAPIEPAPPGALADDAEVAQWRANHEAWREQSDAWRRSQQDAERAAREQARREREAAGAAFAAEAEERRRIRRATKPRTSFVFALTALGAAIVTGAVSVLIALTDAATAPYAAAIGLLAGALVTALAMIVAGIVRRRSGFLTAVTIVLVVAGITTAVASGPRSLAVGDIFLGTSTEPVSVTQPFGRTEVHLSSLSEREPVEAGTITLRKGNGDTYITVNPGTILDLEARLGGGGVSYSRIGMQSGFLDEGVIYPHEAPDGTAEWEWFVRNTTAAGDAETRQRIVLDQAVGHVYVTIYESEEDR
ncbi:PspC domain-containing protein [Microbacterium cremeum]|uniref:PspC domain-containing protein n=1 Tax=Microbacterium cremeum TaxID=2782169 RepID=UPI0018891104|nr:PspC domain-containing protein [Microbacterium cremeum]